MGESLSVRVKKKMNSAKEKIARADPDIFLGGGGGGGRGSQRKLTPSSYMILSFPDFSGC